MPALLTSANAKLWLDAQWAGSLNSSTACTGSTVTAGSGVGCWKDRSASGWDAIAGASNPVLTASAINGKQALRFVKTNPDYFTVTGSGINTIGGADRTLFAVGNARTTYGTAASNSAGTLVAWPGWNGGLFAHANGGTTTVDTLQADGYNSSTSGMYGVTSSTTPALLAAVFSSSGGTLTTGLARNGTGSLTAMSVAGTWITYSNGLWLGSTSATASASYAYPLDGDLGEVVVFNRALTPAERRIVEEYLARHWGQTIAPAAPGAVTANPGNTSAAVSWTAPSWNGGASVTGSTVTASPGGATCTATAPATSCTVNGLTNGTAYTFTVTATNSAGTGPTSAASSSVTPYTVPSAPTLTAATAGDGQVALSWTAPSANGSAITGYTLSYTVTDGFGTSGSGSTTVGAVTSSTFSGLTNGRTYTFTVAATNAAGTGSASSSLTATPYPATIMSASAMRLWLDGGDLTTLHTSSACTGTVTAANQVIGCWSDKSGQGNDVSQSTSGNQPVSAVSAANASWYVPKFDGSNDYLTRSTSTLPSGTSASTTFIAATTLTATPSSAGTQVLYLGGPASTGAGRLVGKATSSASLGTNAVSTTTAMDGTITTSTPFVTSMTFGSAAYVLRASGRPSVSQSYAFNTTSTVVNVSLSSNAWNGPISEVVSLNSALSAADQRTMAEYLAYKWGAPVTPAAPGSPSGTVASTTSVTVSWTAPTWNGGSAITGYTVTSSPGGFTCTTSGTSCTVTGLTHTTGYTFTVTPTNGVGAGQVSAATGTVTP